MSQSIDKSALELTTLRNEKNRKNIELNDLNDTISSMQARMQQLKEENQPETVPVTLYSQIKNERDNLHAAIQNLQNELARVRLKLQQSNSKLVEATNSNRQLTFANERLKTGKRC